jgi:hypothetical protein
MWLVLGHEQVPQIVQNDGNEAGLVQRACQGQPLAEIGFGGRRRSSGDVSVAKTPLERGDLRYIKRVFALRQRQRRGKAFYCFAIMTKGLVGLGYVRQSEALGFGV